MAIKTLFQGQKKGANPALPTANAETVLVYAVPALKSAVVKEILRHNIGTPGSVFVQLYVLKSGGTDAPSNASSIEGQSSASASEAVAIEAESTASITLTRLAMNLCLAAGDAIRMRIRNATGANFDATTFGIRLQISGVES